MYVLQDLYSSEFIIADNKEIVEIQFKFMQEHEQDWIIVEYNDEMIKELTKNEYYD